MSRGALLTGVTGGIVGSITSGIGIIWIFILNTFLAQINDYLVQWTYYLTPILVPWMYGFAGSPPPLYSPSWFLFSASSAVLAIFLIVTAILIGIGFYGIYKIGGGSMSLVGFFFSIVGITLGALLIIMGNLIPGYMYANVLMELAAVPVLPVTTPNFPLIYIGFAVLGLTFILLGSASIAVREMTGNPSASSAAGILNIVGAVFFIIGFIWYIILIVGFGLILVAFILWTVVFYSSREV